MKAILLPSGLHDASRSLESEERVRLRVTPFSTGTSKTSPQAVRSRREPSGFEPKEVSLSATSFSFVRPEDCRRQGLCRFCGSDVWPGRGCRASPPFSNTIRLPSELGNFTSKSENSVTFSVLLGLGVVDEEIHRHVAVGNEENLVADPHREYVPVGLSVMLTTVFASGS